MSDVVGKKTVRVVAAVVEREGRYLITQRREQAVLSLLWEFPGGKVEAGEADEDALRRELRERLDAEGKIGRKLGEKVHEYDGYRVSLLEPPSIEIEFEGRTRDLMMAPTGEFQIRVDADRIAAGQGSLTIEAAEVEHPPDLRIVGIDPPQIRLELRPL